MTYQRARSRNGLMFRDVGAYAPVPNDSAPPIRYMINGDFNRMEQDYLDPQYPEHPWASRPAGSSPGEECAQATGVSLEDVRAVLRYVFMVQP